MVNVAKLWLICDYYGLITITMFIGFICSKTMVNVRKGFDARCLNFIIINITGIHLYIHVYTFFYYSNITVEISKVI